MDCDKCFTKDLGNRLWEHCGESNHLILLGRIGDNHSGGFTGFMAAKISSLPEREREKGHSRPRGNVNREPVVSRGLPSHGWVSKGDSTSTKNKRNNV